MPEQDVAPAEWEYFFDRLTLLRQGWHVSFEEIPTQEVEANLLVEDADMMVAGGQPRLQDISYVEEEDSKRIVLDAGALPTGFLHVIEQPIAVGYEISDDKNDVQISINNEAGMTTVIHLRNPILTDSMEGDFEPELRKDNPDPDELDEL